jgi:hypothetical protein
MGIWIWILIVSQRMQLLPRQLMQLLPRQVLHPFKRWLMQPLSCASPFAESPRSTAGDATARGTPPLAGSYQMLLVWALGNGATASFKARAPRMRMEGVDSSVRMRLTVSVSEQYLLCARSASLGISRCACKLRIQ